MSWYSLQGDACSSEEEGSVGWGVAEGGGGQALSLLEDSGGPEEESLGEFPAGMRPAFLTSGSRPPAVRLWWDRGR